jgi:putative hydrolase of the HAD superfamily
MVIIFDLGKVILDFDHRTITKRLSVRSGIPEGRIHEVIFGGNLESLYDRGELTSGDFYGDVVGSLGVDISFEEFRDVWTRIFTPNEDVCELIRRLKKRHKLILLSNTNEMHFDYALDRFEILKAFDHYIVSYQVGERKPHSKIYMVALERARCPAEACLYIDDVEPFVTAARRLGMGGVVFRGVKGLEKELISLRIVF